MPEKRARYYRDTVESVGLMLIRHVTAEPLPTAPVAGPYGVVRLWRFANNTFQCVFEIPWDELPLWDTSLEDPVEQGSPCGHGVKAEGETEEESSAKWWVKHQERLAKYKPTDIEYWAQRSDVWTGPSWISAVSMKIGCRRGGEIAYDVMGCHLLKNVEDGGIFMAYPVMGYHLLKNVEDGGIFMAYPVDGPLGKVVSPEEMLGGMG